MLSIIRHHHPLQAWVGRRRTLHAPYGFWLFALFLLLPFTGCQTQIPKSPLTIHLLTAPTILAPNQSYTFHLVVSDRATQQPLAQASVEALLLLENGTVEQLFSGQADAQGAVTFTYATPYRQPAGVATLKVQAHSADGSGELQSNLELLPSLLILPRQLPAQVAPGSQSTIVMQVYDPVTQARIKASPVQARLTLANKEEIDLFQGVSDAAGQVEFLLALPTDLPLQPVRLDVYAQAPAGEAHLQRKLTVVAPVTITPLTAPKTVYAGSQVTYTLRINDNVNHEPAADSDVQVYLSGGNYSWGTPLFEGQADASGIVSFTFIAQKVTYRDALYLDLNVQGFEGEARYTQSIEVIPTLALSVLGLAERVTPGSSSEVYLRVWDNRANGPARDAAVAVDLQDNNGDFQQHLTGVTDAAGLFTFRLEPPATVPDAWLNLNVTATTAEAAGAATYGVAVQQGYHALITTDKPVYQPGQTMHMRVLALDSVSNRPAANQSAQLRVYDARGNTVTERNLTTSAYGVATADLALDAQASSGNYQISVAMGTNYNSHTVEVKPYTLPRFQITITDTHPYYPPGATAEGIIEAAYFFGKPVADGQVVIRGYGPVKLNTKAEEKLFEVSGRTDAAGRYAYSLPLPATFRDQLRNKTSKVRLEVEVIDGADHREQSDATVILAEQPLHLEAVPEAGRLKPGLANLVYLQVSRPDGSEAQTTLAVSVDPAAATWQQMTTDSFGLVTLTVTPTRSAELPLLVRYGAGNEQVQATIPLPVERQKTPSLLLRPAAAEVTVGGTLALDLWVAGAQELPAQTQAYVELVKAGQVVQMADVPLAAGHGQVLLPLDPQLVGTVLINAYLLLAGDQRSSDARLVLVNPTPVDVKVTADATVYRPGDTAQLTIAATHDDKPQPGVVGVSIVDESVFALATVDAGFARTFFLLDRELRQARYGIAGFAAFGNAQSPYDSYYTYSTARYPAVEPTLIINAPTQASAASLQQARNTALLAWMAQDLQATASPAPTATPGEQTTKQRPVQRGSAVVLVLVIGLCVYAGRRQLTPPLVACLIAGLSSFLWVACAPAAPAAAPAAGGPPSPAPQSAAPESSNTPRLRQYFPETLLWLPEQATDAEGRTTIAIPLADSITTWRVSVLFSDQAGNLGSAETDLRVFQDFFVEPQLPAQVTQGDELQAPVSIYNYLEQPQRVQLNVAPAAWFSYTKNLSTTVTVAANDVAVAYFPLRVTGVGAGNFAITATGAQMSDRIQRPVTVIDNGEAQTVINSGRLTGTVTLPLTLPVEAITGTRAVTLRLFPNTFSQVRQGLDALVRRPSGNFVEIADKNFANVLLLTLMQQAGVPATDPLYKRAERLSGQGYQRLLAYESDTEPGGFSFYGDPPARPWLSAYALWQLAEMSKISYVDPQLTGRITGYLYQQQLPDGSWPADEMRYYGPWQPRQARLATTAYIVWMLGESGNPNPNALVYLQQAALEEMSDPYIQALVINALLTTEETRAQALTLLRQLAAEAHSEQGLAYWQTGLTTFLGSSGEAADLETTALIAYALLRAKQQPDLAQSGLDYLFNRRAADGAFATSQLTVLALKAVLLAAEEEKPNQVATVTVTMDGQPVQQLTLDATLTAAQEITLTALPPTTTLHIAVDGQLVAPYQLISSYVLPWERVAARSRTAEPPFVIKSEYDRTTVAQHEVVTLQTTITMSQGTGKDQQPGRVVAAIGLPPGFTLLPADLATVAQQRIVSAYAMQQNQLLLYLNRLHPGRRYDFTLRLQANTPGTLHTPPTQVTTLYRNQRRSIDPPQLLNVTQQ